MHANFSGQLRSDITCSGFPTKCVISAGIVSDRLIARGIKETLLINYAGQLGRADCVTLEEND